jgi:6-phosphofructokinase
MEDLRRLGVYTSGGDAPGMNACVRAVVRAAIAHGMEVIGIRRGYAGMIEGDFVEMDRQSVSNILQKGGTILKSARSEAFRTAEGRAIAADKLRKAGITALVGIGGGAELVLIPEMLTDLDQVKDRILSLMSSQSRSSIVVIAEGDETGGAHTVAEVLRADSAFDHIDLRVTVLGHIQRGGSPTARDRVLASRLGSAAVEALVEGHTSVMVGLVNNDVKLTPLRNVWSRKKEIDYELMQLTALLS